MLVHEHTLASKWCSHILLIYTTVSEQTVFSCCPKVAAWRREVLSKASNSITRNSNFRPCFQPNCVRVPIFMRGKRDLNCLVPQNEGWLTKLQWTKWKLDRPAKMRQWNGASPRIVYQLSLAVHWTWIMFCSIRILSCQYPPRVTRVI